MVQLGFERPPTRQTARGLHKSVRAYPLDGTAKRKRLNVPLRSTILFRDSAANPQVFGLRRR
jgi:hypothetical protein